MTCRKCFAMLVAGLLLLTQSAGNLLAEKIRPVIVEPWWQVAGNPDLGPWSSPEQQPVDFAIWQAADGTWQLWSCIRKTRCGGNTRLFYRWEGRRLTDPDWRPMGIAMTADPKYGETPGGLQAPYVIRLGKTYYMFYGDWNHICLATSDDGKTFRRASVRNSRPQLFGELRPGQQTNTRDPMVLRVGDIFYCYYTAYPDRKGAVFCRTSTDLLHWSDSKVVAFGGQAGTNPYSAECPHVVWLKDKGKFILFRTQRYGRNAQTSVYCSPDPLDFGVNDDRYFVCHLPVAAPEIIYSEGHWYIAALMPSLNGIRMAKLRWETVKDD